MAVSCSSAVVTGRKQQLLFWVQGLGRMCICPGVANTGGGARWGWEGDCGFGYGQVKLDVPMRYPVEVSKGQVDIKEQSLGR